MAVAELAVAELVAAAVAALGSSSFNLQLIIPIVFPYIFYINSDIKPLIGKQGLLHRLICCTLTLSFAAIFIGRKIERTTSVVLFFYLKSCY
jgi:hypothetical protein